MGQEKKLGNPLWEIFGKKKDSFFRLEETRID